MSDEDKIIGTDDRRFIGATTVGSGAVLTEELLRKTFEKIKNAPPPPPKCPPHLVRATARARVLAGGTARCVECGTLLDGSALTVRREAD